MVYLRAGTVTEQPGIVTRILDLPTAIYQFFMFFIMTLVDVSHASTPRMPTASLLLLPPLPPSQTTPFGQFDHAAHVAPRHVCMKLLRGAGGLPAPRRTWLT